MSVQGNIKELAAGILTQVTSIHEALAAAGQPDPSFDINALPTEFNAAGVQDLRTAVLSQIEDLHDLLMTPLEGLFGVAATDYISRHALDQFNVYDLIPIGETRTYAQLSESTGLPIAAIRRLIRHAMTQRIFAEPEPGIVAHTPTSKLLAENSAARDYCGVVAQIVSPAASQATYAMKRWPSAVGKADPTKTGFFLSHGKILHQMLADEPEVHRRYDSAMGISRHDMSYSVEHIANGFEWASLGKATVVDVAGGVGNVSLELARRFPQLHFIVQDQAEVIAGVNLEAEEEDVKSRVTYMGHDMFTPQPVKYEAVYFFRRVFMEWTDEKSSDILRNLVPALKEKHSLVIIADFYVPEPGTTSRWQERRFRSTDLLSLALANGGGKRDREDWEAVFQNADEGYIVESVTPLKNSDMMLTVAAWSPSLP